MIAEQHTKDMIEIIGIGKSSSEGLKKGIVVDIGKTVNSIKQAVYEAQIMANCSIEKATIGISGSHIKSIDSRGVVPIKRGEVTRYDIANVLASAKAIAIPEGQHILHVLPQYFMIDTHEKVHDPIGMYGVRLEAQVHIITGAVACVQNLIKCCELAGIQVTDIILEHIASAAAVLSNDERTLGIGMLDIGGGTSDLAIYKNNSIYYTSVFPVAGNQFTQDVAIGLQTPLHEAERIKKEYNNLNPEGLCKATLLSDAHSREISFLELHTILQPRAEELLFLVKRMLVAHQLYPIISAGMVLTGGGSLLSGLTQLAQKILNIPVRIAKPRLTHAIITSLDNPMYATAYGLLLQSLKKEDTATIDRLSGPLINRVMARMKSWVSDFF